MHDVVNNTTSYITLVLYNVICIRAPTDPPGICVVTENTVYRGAAAQIHSQILDLAIHRLHANGVSKGAFDVTMGTGQM